MKPKSEWGLEDYAAEIKRCRDRAIKSHRSGDGWDAIADRLSKEAAKFGTEKLPLFKESNESR